MRLKRWRKHRWQAAGAAPTALAACAFALGCQSPSYDHVDGSSAAFNASRIPAAGRPASASDSNAPSKATAVASNESAGSTPSAPASGNEALVAENLNLGHREAALNRLEEAETYYRRVLEIQPENTVANHRLGVLADKKGDFKQAEHYYLAALRHDARNADLLGDLGYSYLLQGRRKESEHYLIAATQIDPTHSKALHNLSLLYALNGDYDRSFDALRRAVGENEARVKIARLFPNGRPGSTGGEEMVASFDPAPAGSVNPIAVNSESAEASHEKETEPSPPSSLPPSSLTEPVATAASTTAAAMGQHAAVSVPTGGRIPDSQINDAFAAIDREQAHEPSFPLASPSPASTTTAGAPAIPAVPQTSPSGGTNAFDAADLQAPAGSDPLASMPMWAPAPPAAPQHKPPADFLFDEDPVPIKTPRAVPLAIVPASANHATAMADGNLLDAYKAALRKDQAANSGRTQSNRGPAREPLLAKPAKTAQNGPADSQSGTDKTPVAPFDVVPSIRIQPRSEPAPLFEPVEGFGPGNDFAPGNDTVPAWPGAKGNPAAPNGNAADGPVITPGS
jgi:tetratricopeptide (TPR) repeat protein